MNKEEIEQLITLYEHGLLQYAFRMLGSDDYVADAVQEAFIGYCRARAQKKHINNPQAWLYGVVRNKCIDFMRKHQRKVSLEVTEEYKQQNSKDDYSPDKAMITVENLEIIKSCFDDLNVREREVVSLKLEQQKSYKEIADILDISSSNVGFIMHSAMKKMRQNIVLKGGR
ncbi:RNA polymerase sigma factor [Lentisphaerota bacterium WC36G]|nr:RNA polymerase sigma factor [Lentisphaerae bacterium WC36]